MLPIYKALRFFFVLVDVMRVLFINEWNAIIII